MFINVILFLVLLFFLWRWESRYMHLKSESEEALRLALERLSQKEDDLLKAYKELAAATQKLLEQCRRSAPHAARKPARKEV